jgi:hypothetical protein
MDGVANDRSLANLPFEADGFTQKDLLVAR